MGILSKVSDFLFGKNPDIFDNAGNVSHKLTKRTWDSWMNRYKMNPNYNWRNHTGTRVGRELGLVDGSNKNRNELDNKEKH